jgi:hypothetical protein
MPLCSTAWHATRGAPSPPPPPPSATAPLPSPLRLSPPPPPPAPPPAPRTAPPAPRRSCWASFWGSAAAATRDGSSAAATQTAPLPHDRCHRVSVRHPRSVRHLRCAEPRPPALGAPTPPPRAPRATAYQADGAGCCPLAASLRPATTRTWTCRAPTPATSPACLRRRRSREWASAPLCSWPSGRGRR